MQSGRLRFSWSTFTLLCCLLACRHVGTANSDVKSIPPPPAADKIGAKLAKDEVYKAMVAIRKTFYQDASIYSVAPKNAAGKKTPPPMDEPTKCLDACPLGRWSDLVCHYYCQFPAYAGVVPNIRGCFSRFSPVLSSYSVAYDFCVYQDFDAVLREKNNIQYDANIVAANKAAVPPRKPGVMKWVDDNQRDIFKYLMFTNGNIKAFDRKDRQEVINKFYDVHLSKAEYTTADTIDVAECRKKRPRLNTEREDGTHCSVSEDSIPKTFLLNRGVYQFIGTKCEVAITNMDSVGDQMFGFNAQSKGCGSSTMTAGENPFGSILGATWNAFGCAGNACFVSLTMPGGSPLHAQPLKVLSVKSFEVMSPGSTWNWVHP